MQTSGFTSTPTSKLLLTLVVLLSLLASALDVKPLFRVRVDPDLVVHGQAWRVAVWQACYGNAAEVLFAGMLGYRLRVVERGWGSRKFAGAQSFILTTLPYTTLLPPLLLACLLRPLSLYTLNALPSGPTPLLFAILSQYHALIPPTYRYVVAAPPLSLSFSDKSYTYLLAAQLALSQLPGSLIGAAVGWMVGYAWRAEVLVPGEVWRWRVPKWVVGEGGRERGFEGLRRRLEGEVGGGGGGAGAGAGRASGREGEGEGQGVVRRSLGTQILDQFRGAF
ncbi:hypothetical protein FGG08_005953 [Glutinoglossum americanum]|uniref:DSC E3 ubiquitin ligase complex subunit 2 n=1 Tax=Glutinoglossum americanum TaxID=1670608 RepID=A0A9P8KY02_9PEZI|nr:hypothetical protein FGG08_005953 [Glutinoglossum americanum]